MFAAWVTVFYAFSPWFLFSLWDILGWFELTFSQKWLWSPFLHLLVLELEACSPTPVFFLKCWGSIPSFYACYLGSTLPTKASKKDEVIPWLLQPRKIMMCVVTAVLVLLVILCLYLCLCVVVSCMEEQSSQDSTAVKMGSVCTGTHSRASLHNLQIEWPSKSWVFWVHNNSCYCVSSLVFNYNDNYSC